MTEDMFEFIETKYGGLIHKIANNISGDNAIASIEDNVQDLYLSVYDAINGFEKQGINGTPNEFIDTTGFDKYLKTTLWSKKASKGRGITTKMPVQGRGCASISDVSAIVSGEAVVHSDFDVYDFWDELGIREFHEEEKALISVILRDPNSCISAKGGIKISPVMRKLNISRERAERLIDSVGQKISTIREKQHVN